MLVTGYDLDAHAWIELGDAAPPEPTATVGPCRSPTRSSRPNTTPSSTRCLPTPAPRSACATTTARSPPPGRWACCAGRCWQPAPASFGADPSLAVEATVDELAALLAGQASIDVEALETRRDERAANSALDAPQTLGPEFAIPPLGALPRPLRTIGAAQLATAEHMFTGQQAVGVGTASYTGRALVVDDPAVAMRTFEPGDVIITSATSPAWNTVLVHAGALVTANGGLVSHAAVIARELGIPAVIGDTTACARLRTGCVVTVDPIRATVIAVTTGP